MSGQLGRSQNVAAMCMFFQACARYKARFELAPVTWQDRASGAADAALYDTGAMGNMRLLLLADGGAVSVEA